MYIGGAGKLLSVAERISRKLLDLQQTRQGFEQQKTDWPKDADVPHNRYARVESDGGVRGGATARAKRRGGAGRLPPRPDAPGSAQGGRADAFGEGNARRRVRGIERRPRSAEKEPEGVPKRRAPPWRMEKR